MEAIHDARRSFHFATSSYSSPPVNMSNSDSPYAARPPPASFDDFMAQVDAATQAHGGIMVDEEIYEELFASAAPG